VRFIERFGIAGVVLVGCLLGGSAAHGQGAAASAEGNKVGVINMLQAISSTAEGKQASTSLQAQFGARQQELEALNKQITDLQQRLSANDATLNDQERARLGNQGTLLTQRLDRKKNEYQEDLNTAQGELVNEIGRKMMEVVNRYAQEHNYAVILDASSQNSTVLYATKSVDVTQDVVRLYDQAHPVKAAASSGGAGASKPQ
jgi:outer membrane protein